MGLGAAEVNSQLTVVRKLDGASEERARTSAKDAEAREEVVTGVLAALQVADERWLILSTVFQARIRMSTCLRCWHCATNLSKVL